MVIFHSYVSLPEGINFLNDGWTLALKFRKPWVFFLPSNIREKSHDNRYQMLPTNMGFYHCCSDQFRHPITGKVIVTSWFLMFLCKHPRQLIAKKTHGIGGLGENPNTSKTGWISNYQGVEAVETQISWYNSQSLVSMVTEAPVNFISWQPCKRDRLLPCSLIQSNSVRQASNWSNQQNYPRNSSGDSVHVDHSAPFSPATHQTIAVHT